MKLLFDQNISHKLVDLLSQYFPGSEHVFRIGLDQADDKDIWQYCKDNDYAIVTQDSDFHEKSLLYGFPPKVIWLRLGNSSTKNIQNILIKKQVTIHNFSANAATGCLEIYG